MDAPFEYADRLASLVQRQREIEDALDLTKNQAPQQLGDETTETVGNEADAEGEE